MSKLFIKIWDVQHGSAAYINTPSGKHIVIDLGIGDVSGNDTIPGNVFSPLLHLKRHYGVNQLDEVIITHPHKDHIDDIFNFDKLEPKVLRRPTHISEEDVRKGNKPGDSAFIDKYFEINNRYSRTLDVTEDPEYKNNNGGVIIRVFQPTNCASTNLNNQSTVVFLNFAGSTICIPGDNEGASWTELLKNDDFITWLKNTDILVASHHGRESGYCEEMMQYCLELKLVIISDGPQGNTCVADKYGNKAKGWLVHSLSGAESKTRYCLTTRTDGAMEIECYSDDDKNYLIVNKE